MLLSHIATGRQQLLSTMVILGLNRIVVTNGKIAAKTGAAKSDQPGDVAEEVSTIRLAAPGSAARARP